MTTTQGLTFHDAPIQLYEHPVHADGQAHDEPEEDVEEPTHDQVPTGGYL